MHEILSNYLLDYPIDRKDLYHALLANNAQDGMFDGNGYYVSNSSGLDIPLFWNKFKSNPDTYKGWDESGWLKADGSIREIKYRINNSGFRGAHFTNDPALVFFGCSFTFGTGIPEEKIWPTLTSKHFNLQCCNLGIPGHGLDFQSLYSPLWLLNEIPNPRAFLIKFPPQPRITLYREKDSGLYLENIISGVVEAQIHNNPLMRLIANSALSTSKINTFIALNSIVSLAEKLGIPVIKINNVYNINTDNSVARDFYHPGADWHAAMSVHAIRKLEAVL